MFFLVAAQMMRMLSVTLPPLAPQPQEMVKGRKSSAALSPAA
jgi:hypothetical protein